MPTEFEMPAKAAQYLRRLIAEYRRAGAADLAEILESARFRVDIGTEHEKWDGGIDGHDVVLFIPERLMGLVPLDDQQSIQSKLKEDLNKVNSIRREFVSAVQFEYEDPSSTRASSALPVSASGQMAADASFWKSDLIKVFISHRDGAKSLAHDLATRLERLGMTSFVAHDTIEPDEDWQREIEKALHTMDVMIALLTEKFFESAWTNQEIGFALAKGVPVISLKVSNVDPAGFIRNRQAIKGNSARMVDCALTVSQTIIKRLGNSQSIRRAILARFTNAPNFASAGEFFADVEGLQILTEAEVDQLVLAFNQNDQIRNCFALTDNQRFLKFINAQGARLFEMEGRQIAEAEVPF